MESNALRLLSPYSVTDDRALKEDDAKHEGPGDLYWCVVRFGTNALEIVKLARAESSSRGGERCVPPRLMWYRRLEDHALVRVRIDAVELVSVRRGWLTIRHAEAIRAHVRDVAWATPSITGLGKRLRAFENIEVMNPCQDAGWRTPDRGVLRSGEEYYWLVLVGPGIGGESFVRDWSRTKE